MRWRSVSLSEILNANLSLAPKDYIMDTSINGGTMMFEKILKERDGLQKLIDIMWDYISEKDIPEISKRLEEEE
ncbi:MAG: hypothetical protein CBD62_01065 [Candidatus Pelagibacter sp. TMED202]|nr:MAG: hypothetical protein CBD62_01065 [Candidatus Pelagibacter sp. TMED202]|tara:strand:- start:2014 stop:2235 length:222 start_codon:yes stop_codon:yes gene_type:complete